MSTYTLINSNTEYEYRYRRTIQWKTKRLDMISKIKQLVQKYEQDKKIITRLLILEELESEVKNTIKEEEKKFKLERRI